MDAETLENRARAYLETHKDRESHYEDFELLPDEVAERVAQLQREEARREDAGYFVPANAGSRWEATSPSGKYRLEVTSYRTKQGCWSYTRGVVSVKDGDGWRELPQDIKRNFSSFAASWIEGHPNGHDYLVGGADYQGQTVLELTTGRRRDFIPKEAMLGWAFCWIGHEYHADSRLLIVDGCYWACPEERRLYDFSSPMDGWPELILYEGTERVAVEPDAKLPTIEGRVVKFYHTEGEDLRSVKTFEREGHRLLFKEEWVSEDEQKKRRDEQEARERHEAWWAEFKRTDPLYVEMRRLAEGLPGEDHVGLGWVHDR